jgi:tetratricopeptide (TPR) repeat protein
MNISFPDVLSQLIQQNLELCLYDTAQFYAERLYYEQPNVDNLYLLAQCFYKQGKIKQTYLLLQGCETLQARYLLAIVCVSLRKYREAERALIRNPVPANAIASLSTASIPGGAAGFYLLGNICRAENRRDAAIAYFQAALQVSTK